MKRPFITSEKVSTTYDPSNMIRSAPTLAERQLSQKPSVSTGITAANSPTRPTTAVQYLSTGSRSTTSTAMTVMPRMISGSSAW